MDVGQGRAAATSARARGRAWKQPRKRQRGVVPDEGASRKMADLDTAPSGGVGTGYCLGNSPVGGMALKVVVEVVVVVVEMSSGGGQWQGEEKATKAKGVESHK